MIKIFPELSFTPHCPYCGSLLRHAALIWQGMHICSDCICQSCGKEFLCDLPSNQATVTPYIFDKVRGEHLAFETTDGKISQYDNTWSGSMNFFTEIFNQIINYPQNEQIPVKIERFKDSRKAIVLNTLDYLYGHSSPFLFNAERHLRRNPDLGLVLIIQPWLRWLVPEGVAEVWTAQLPVSKGRMYFPELSKSICKELERFEEVWLSPADTQPTDFDISRFTKIPRHDFDRRDFRITFIWREDIRRMWYKDTLPAKVLRKIGFISTLRAWQLLKVRRLFTLLRERLPEARFTIAGLGTYGTFLSWVDDCRIDKFDEDIERVQCRIFSESRLVIGVLGSSMILPSAHAGMAVSLIPRPMRGNFAQDLIFNEHDDRLAVFQKRILPIEVSIREIADICEQMVHFRNGFMKRMVIPFTL